MHPPKPSKESAVETPKTGVWLSLKKLTLGRPTSNEFSLGQVFFPQVFRARNDCERNGYLMVHRIRLIGGRPALPFSDFSSSGSRSDSSVIHAFVFTRTNS